LFFSAYLIALLLAGEKLAKICFPSLVKSRQRVWEGKKGEEGRKPQLKNG